VRLQANEAASWERLWRLYAPVVEQWCASAGLQKQDADDVAQEVFRAVVSGINGFRRERTSDTFRGWLWTIARNKPRDFLRQRAKAAAAAGGTDAQIHLAQIPEELSEEISLVPREPKADGLFRRALDEIQANFEPRTWQAFWKTTVEEQPAAEVAAALGMSAGAVYVAKSRVLARLREELGDVLE
jgi:RNA polymerase sigma-70 factor (ECF subfamily)